MADMNLEGLQKLEELLKASDVQNPSRKQMIDMIDSADFSDEMKENLRAMIRGDVPQVFGSYGSGAIMGVIFVAIIFAVLIFFGYKLYKSIKEKEVKKEEKKKLKQMKKKK